MDIREYKLRKDVIKREDAYKILNRIKKKLPKIEFNKEMIIKKKVKTQRVKGVKGDSLESLPFEVIKKKEEELIWISF